MLNWLKGIYNGTRGILSDIEKWIVGALNVMYSYFESLISQLWSGLQSLASSISRLIGQLEQSLVSLYNLANWIITKAIPDLASRAWNELTRLWKFAQWIYDQAVSELNLLRQVLLDELNKLLQWVIDHVWTPLWTLITNAIKWIENEGAYVYYLLTHPDKLAAILAQYILGQVMNLGRRFAKPFIKWLMHSMVNEIPTVSSIIEDIIASLF